MALAENMSRFGSILRGSALLLALVGCGPIARIPQRPVPVPGAADGRLMIPSALPITALTDGARIPLTGDELPGVGVYGAGLAGFVLVPVSRGIAGRVLDGAGGAGGVEIDIPRGRAVRVATPLLSLAVSAGRRGGVLLVGTVAPEVLERAVLELAGNRA